MYAAVLCLNRTLVCIQVPHMPKAGIARMTCMTWELHKMLTCMQVLALTQLQVWFDKLVSSARELGTAHVMYLHASLGLQIGLNTAAGLVFTG